MVDMAVGSKKMLRKLQALLLQVDLGIQLARRERFRRPAKDECNGEGGAEPNRAAPDTDCSAPN
jgi:hypothetical protein